MDSGLWCFLVLLNISVGNTAAALFPWLVEPELKKNQKCHSIKAPKANIAIERMLEDCFFFRFVKYPRQAHCGVKIAFHCILHGDSRKDLIDQFFSSSLLEAVLRYCNALLHHQEVLFLSNV